MGWRFRKVFGRGPFRWTLSKRGVGFSWGIPGLIRYGISPNGQRYISLSIPGTGLYWIKYLKDTPPAPPQLPRSPTPPPALPPPTSNPAASPPTTQTPWWKQKDL